MPIKHTIRQGESTISLSEDHGFFAGTLWDDPANAELKQKRKDMNVLMSGDVLNIPDKQAKEIEKPDAKKHRFKRKGIPAMFRIQVFDAEEPRANQSYRFVVDGRVTSGTTNASGVIEEYLPANAVKGEVIIGPDEFRFELQFGHLDPADEIVGIQKRLNNIGFNCGEPTGEMNSCTHDALTAFQKRFGIQSTGEPDAPTLERLQQAHDSNEEFPTAAS